MKREKEMVIRIPKEMEQDFRLFTVLNGGQIVEVKKLVKTNQNNKGEN